MSGAARVFRLLTTAVSGRASWSLSRGYVRAHELERGRDGVPQVEEDLPCKDVGTDGRQRVGRLRSGDGIDHEVRGLDRRGMAGHRHRRVVDGVGVSGPSVTVWPRPARAPLRI
jgi:hypothetical protein